MAIRIVGVDLPQNKRGEIALTYIFGIGRSTANRILAEAGVDKDMKVNDWNDQRTRDALVRIQGYANDNELPLTFQGYPATEDFKLHIEMWSLLNWIGNGDGSQHISDYRLRHDEDLTDKYAVMLEVYQNIRSSLQFDLNGLEQMVKSRQFYIL